MHENFRYRQWQKFGQNDIAVSVLSNCWTIKKKNHNQTID